MKTALLNFLLLAVLSFSYSQESSEPLVVFFKDYKDYQLKEIIYPDSSRNCALSLISLNRGSSSLKIQYHLSGKFWIGIVDQQKLYSFRKPGPLSILAGYKLKEIRRRGGGVVFVFSQLFDDVRRVVAYYHWDCPSEGELYGFAVFEETRWMFYDAENYFVRELRQDGNGFPIVEISP